MDHSSLLKSEEGEVRHPSDVFNTYLSSHKKIVKELYDIYLRVGGGGNVLVRGHSVVNQLSQ